MNFFRAHPYTAGIGAACILVLIGVAVVVSRTPASEPSSTLTWSGGGQTTSYQSVPAASLSPQQIAQEVIQGNSGQPLVIPPLATSAPATTSSGSLDYVSLLAQLSAGSAAKPGSSSASSSIISQAYQFIPQGLIASAAPQKNSTPAEQALYLYGNAVGGEIQSFETLHTNEAQVLKDEAEDRTDIGKQNSLISLGQALSGVGTFMQGMQEVPSSAASYHAALAQSYVDIGAKLQLVAKAQSDSDFVQAVQNYDSSVDTFVHNYAALAQFFIAQGVVFSSTDPGSVFSFSESGPL